MTKIRVTTADPNFIRASELAPGMVYRHETNSTDIFKVVDLRANCLVTPDAGRQEECVYVVDLTGNRNGILRCSANALVEVLDVDIDVRPAE